MILDTAKVFPLIAMMRNPARICGALVLATAPLAAARAQEQGPLVTDRPDQTESTATVALGFVQLELGWVMERDVEADVSSTVHAVPQALARVGVAAGLEARVGFGGWIRQSVEDAPGSPAVSGLGDLDLGAKYRLHGGAGLRPSVAVIGSVTLPTGEEGVGVERASPAVRLALASELGEHVGLGYNVGLEWDAQRDAAGRLETLTDLVYTLALGIALGPRVGTFAEVFGSFALADAGSSAHLVDGGLTYLVSDAVQVDVSGGGGFAGDPVDWFLGAGLSLRLGW